MNTPLSEEDKIRAQLKIHPQILTQLCTSRDFNDPMYLGGLKLASTRGIKSQAKIVEVVMVISGWCVSLQTIYNADSPDRTNTSSHPFLNQMDTLAIDSDCLPKVCYPKLKNSDI